jgi:hypothetical protein
MNTARLDSITRANSAFATFDELLSQPCYRPSLDQSQPVLVELADAYDAAMTARNDDRRAYRYGTPQPQPAAPAWNLSNAKEACKKEREAAMREIREIRRHGRFVKSMTRNREPVLWACDAKGERLNGLDWLVWRRRWSDVTRLIAAYPQAVEIVVDSGIDYAENMDTLMNGDYDTEHWTATVWRAES